MSKKQSAVTVIIIILVLLIAGILLYQQRSAEKEKEAEEAQQLAGRARPAEKREEERPEVEVAQPEEPPVREEAVPAEEPEPAAPVSPLPVPPPVSTAECRADSEEEIRTRSASSPEGMVYIPGGVFTMGSPPDTGQADESPAHGVCLRSFYIDRYEVTNAEFREFVEATGYVTDAEKRARADDERTWQHPRGAAPAAEEMPEHPVVCVSWNDANAYARWAGKRLPTEAEWEKAARGTDGRVYPWGNESLTGTNANIADKTAALRWSDKSIVDNHKMTAPVGSFPDGTSVYGVEDAAGNVWEWCYDWWDNNYYTVSPGQNPTGPETGEFKVIRGGSWFYTSNGARTAHRMYFRPGGISEAIGFRCAKDVE